MKAKRSTGIHKGTSMFEYLFGDMHRKIKNNIRHAEEFEKREAKKSKSAKRRANKKSKKK